MTESMLTRTFFRAFFGVLVLRGISRIKHHGEGSEDTRVKFRRAYGVLAALEEAHEDVDCLIRILRPDPISGAINPFEWYLLELNPGWTLSHVRLHAHAEPFGSIPNLQILVEAMADAYLGG